jgi:uncharacterized SAM-binding protein YcdF (DUF218 family)
VTPGGRLLVVMGYSAGRANGLHPICAARVERAAREAGDAAAVLLSGRARRAGELPEAELMRRAWPGSPEVVVVDPEARITAETAAEAAALARKLGLREVLAVTSWWHQPRAALFLRRLMRDRGVRVATIGAKTPWSLRLIVRELCCLALVPSQLRRVRARLDA